MADNIRCLYRDRAITKIAGPSHSSRRISEKIPAVVQKIQHDPEALVISERQRRPLDPYAAWKQPKHRRGPKFCSDFPSSEVTQLIGSKCVFPARSEAEAEAYLLEAYRKMDEANANMEIEMDELEDEDASGVIDDAAAAADEAPIPDSRTEEEEELSMSIDGPPPSTSTSNGRADGSEKNGDEVREVQPPASVRTYPALPLWPPSQRQASDNHNADAGRSTGPIGGGDIVRRSTPLRAAGPSSARGGSTDQVDGDQGARRQVSQPSWTILPSTS